MDSALPSKTSDTLSQQPASCTAPSAESVPQPSNDVSPRASLETLSQASTEDSSPGSGQYRSKYGRLWDRYIRACEGGFKGIINWPSNGGTLEEANAMLTSLEGAASGQLLILGLRKLQDTSVVEEVKCCEYAGYVTALIGIVGSPGVHLWDIDWKSITELEDSPPGYYPISYPESWVIVL